MFGKRTGAAVTTTGVCVEAKVGVAEAASVGLDGNMEEVVVLALELELEDGAR